jgi:maltose phosphorylase
MKEGWYNRSFEATLQNGTQIAVNIRRFPFCFWNQTMKSPLNKDTKIIYKPILTQANEDANWDEKWEPLR